MTKPVKIVLIVAAAAAALGLLIGSAGIFFYGGLKNSGNFESYSKSYTSDIDGIRVSVNTGDVNIYPVTGQEITVLYYDNENHYFDIGMQGNTLVITRKEPRQAWYRNWFHVNIRDYELELGIPSDFSGSVNIGATTGDLKASKLSFTSEASFETTTGDIRLAEITCEDDLLTSVTTGQIRLMGVNIAGDLTALGTTGDIMGDNVICGGRFVTSHTTGDINITGLCANSVSATASTGHIKISRMSVIESIYLEATTGDVRCSVTDGAENYSITGKAKIGDNNLPAQGSRGQKTLEVYTTTGDINFKFEQ